MTTFFSQANYDLLLKRFGSDADYYESRLCSCTLNNEGQPDPNCTCIFGYRYELPVRTRLQYNAVSEKMRIMSAGQIPEGSCNITVYPTTRNPDRTITQVRMYKTVHKGDILVFPAQSLRARNGLTKGVQDTLFAFGVNEILSVSYLNTVYIKDTDYELETAVVDGLTFFRIKWIDGENAPPDNGRYVVEYIGFEQYECLESLKQDRGSDSSVLPKQLRFVKRSLKFKPEVKNTLDSMTYDQ